MTNPILILQLKKLLASLTILLHLLLLQPAHNPNLLGAATVTSGNSFPTSTYSFSDNDIVNAGDFNNFSSYMGIRSATDTISLQGQIFNVSSTANNVSVTTATGTLPVSKGGTGVTSSTYGVVISSSTNPFITISPQLATTSILASVSSTWAAFNLVAGTSTSITTSSNSIIINSTAMLPLFILSTSSAVAGTAITFTSTAYTGIATSTFTLANAGRVMVVVAGVAHNNGNVAGDGCQFTSTVDGTDMDSTAQNGLSIYQNQTATDFSGSIGFTAITSSTLTAATHTINLKSLVLVGGTCIIRFNMQVEYMGN